MLSWRKGIPMTEIPTVVEEIVFDDYADLIDEYEKAQAEVSKAKAYAAEIHAHLVKLLASKDQAPDGSVGVVRGQQRISYKPSTVRKVDLDRLRKVYPQAAADCTDYVVRWTLRTHRGGE